ncbi:MAG: N-acetyltransferase [Rickettsiales bacterium]|nr:N-acetyltransferase [Rickettsiales bacterium]
MKDNTAQNRFELVIEGHTVFADYRKDGNDLYIDHVEAPTPLRGKGAAGQLMQHIADKAKAENLKIIPICGYAATWLKRNA